MYAYSIAVVQVEHGLWWNRVCSQIFWSVFPSPSTFGTGDGERAAA